MTSPVTIGAVNFQIDVTKGTTDDRAGFYNLLSNFSQMPSFRQALGNNGTAVSTVQIVIEPRSSWPSTAQGSFGGYTEAMGSRPARLIMLEQ